MRCQTIYAKRIIIVSTIISLSTFLLYTIYSMVTHTVNLYILILLAVLFAINYVIFIFFL